MQTIKVYHGTNAVFDRFEQSKSRILNDFFGGGVAYFTDDFSVAKTYAASMSRSKGGDRIVYDVDLKALKTFDVDYIFTGKELTQFFTPHTSEDFARGSSLLPLGVDKYSILSDLESGKIKMTGKEVFLGLSNGMNRTAQAREKLQKLGYDSLRYNGGENMGAKRHSVYLTYKSDNIVIRNVYFIDTQDNKHKLERP